MTYHGVIRKIWTRLVAGRRSGRTLPARNVNCVEIFCHLCDHYRIQAAIGIACFFVLSSISEACNRILEEPSTFQRASIVFHSFFACALLGYSIAKFPLFATICSAVNGRLVCLHLSSLHHFFTAATSAWNCCSSASTEDTDMANVLVRYMSLNLILCAVICTAIYTQEWRMSQPRIAIDSKRKEKFND
jgi:hypothetical protein